MAVPGREPKEQVRYRSIATADWTEVPNEPYAGPSPDLPTVDGFTWRSEVGTWWDLIRRMPHCILWADADWMFALETAFMKQNWWVEYFDGVVMPTKSTEIRRREDQMGTTLEARRKLRIRYSDATPEESTSEVDGTVSRIDALRRRAASGS